MNEEQEPQKFQLTKSKRDATIDLVSLAMFSGMIYFVLNPDAFDKLTGVFNVGLSKLTHRVGVWQTKLSIRSLPETDDS